MRVDHLFLVLSEVLDRINRSRVTLKVRHYKLLGKMVRGDFFLEWWVRGSQAARLYLLLELLTCFVDPLSNSLLNILDVRDIQSLVATRILEVLFITGEVRSSTPSIALSVSGSRSKRW